MNNVSVGTVPPPPRNTPFLSSETAQERPGRRKMEREKRMSLDSETTFGGIQYGLSNPWPFWVWFLRGRILQAPFPDGSDGKESACSAGDAGSIPGLGRSPGEGNDYPFQCSCLENSMDRRAWWATVHGVAKSQA